MKENQKIQKHRIGEILIDYGLITHEQLTLAIKRQSSGRKRLGSILEEMGYVDNDTLLSTLSKQHKVPYVNLFEIKVPAEVLNLLSFEQVRAFNVLPFKNSDKNISLAMIDPNDFDTIQNMEFAASSNIKPFVVPHYQMTMALRCFESEGYGKAMFDGEKLMQEA
jgi:hypothetical protein